MSSAYEIAFRWFDSFLCLFGIFFNLVLIYCIAKKSPKSIATYSYLLMNCAVSDLLTCGITLFVEPRMIINEDNFYYIANGFCSFISHKACFIGYAIMANLYGHLTLSQLASFVYRWYILHWENPSKKAMSLAIFVIWIPTLFVFFSIMVPYVAKNINKTYHAEIAAVHPDLDLSVLATFGIPHAMTDFIVKIPTLYVTLPIVPITVIVFILRHIILKNLAQHGFISEQTKKMHQCLLKALTLQAFLPFLYLIGIALWQTAFETQNHSLFFEYVGQFLCGLIPILAPLFPLYFVTAYRKYLSKMILGKYSTETSSHVTPSFSITNSSGVARPSIGRKS